MNLTRFFLKKPIITNLATVLILFIGLLVLNNLNQSTYPNVDFDIIKITTLYPGASAEDVEVNVTNAIEEELEKVDDIDKILSSSLENLSIIYVFVDTNAPNIERVKDEIGRAVDRVSNLPQEVDEKPHMKELRSTNVAVIEIGILGDAPEGVLRKIAKDFEDEVKEIPGVGSVEKVGYRKREVKILADTKALAENYISLNDIVQAIWARNVRAAGGNLASFTDEKKIVTFAEFEEPMDVRNVIVRSNFSGQQIRLGQLAKIEDTFEDYDVRARTNQKNSINLLIRSQANADIITISNEAKNLIEKFNKTLPKNVQIVIVSDFSHYTDKLLSIVKNNALIGFVLVLVSLFIFLNSYTAIWTAAGILLSVLGAVIFFPLFNIDINFMSLLAMVLVLGLLVDDAIVIAESISRHREMGKNPIEAAIAGVEEVFWPVFATIVTTILAFASMFFMTGVTGKFVAQIPLVVILTLGFSLLESTTLLPVHIAYSPAQKPKKPLWFERFKNFYESTLTWVLRHRAKTIFVFMSFLMVCSLLLIFRTKIDLFPYEDIDIFYVIAELPEGASQDQTSVRMLEVENLVGEIPESERINHTTRIGHHDTNVYGATSGIHDNWAMVIVYLKPAEDRNRTSEMIMAELEKNLKTITGFKKLYLEKFNDGPPIGKPITISFVSDDDKIRRQFAHEAYEFISGIEGVIGLDMDEKKGKQELRLKPDFELMSRLGITSRTISQTIRAAYDGFVPTHMTLEGEEIDFRVQLKEEQRKNINILKTLQIPNHAGKLIPLGSFTTLVPSKGYETIKHYNGRRSITLTADVKKNKITSKEANQLIREKFLKRVEATPGIRLVFGGEEQATQESMRSFYWAFLCVMLAVYCVLVVLFQSYLIKPLIIMSAIPFGLGGVVLTLWAHGLPISFLAMIGSLGLIGIVVNDSLILVTFLSKLAKAQGKVTHELILEGAKTRLRPVLLTTITTVAGLIPTIYGFGGYEPFLVPIVLSVAGGLIFATAITLILVPVSFSVLHEWEERVGAWIQRRKLMRAVSGER